MLLECLLVAAGVCLGLLYRPLLDDRISMWRGELSAWRKRR